MTSQYVIAYHRLNEKGSFEKTDLMAHDMKFVLFTLRDRQMSGEHHGGHDNGSSCSVSEL